MYVVKFNVLILNRLKVMVFVVNTEYILKCNVIFNKTVTKLVSILTKCSFPYLNPTSYLNINYFYKFFGFFDISLLHKTSDVTYNKLCRHFLLSTYSKVV